MRWLLQLAFLPYEALINAHAIGITLVRLFITRRHPAAMGNGSK